jgi:hypothetical protein
MGLSVCFILVRRLPGSSSSCRSSLQPARPARLGWRPASRRSAGSGSAGRPGLLAASPTPLPSTSCAPSGWSTASQSFRWTGVPCIVLLGCFSYLNPIVLCYLYFRPFTWILGALYRMGASCRERLTRRQSAASNASGQPDLERVSVFLKQVHYS